MKITKLLTGLILISVVLTISSCGDDDPKPASKTDLLVAKSWKLTSHKENGTEMIEDYYDDCELDDLLKFTSDGKYTVDGGTNKCDSSEPQIIADGTWVFESSETKLKVIEDGDTTLFTIDELTSSTLKISITETFQGVTYTTIITFTAQ